MCSRRGRNFQCSSASRKFLNASPTPDPPARRFLSVLFSEPKIPQYRGSAPVSRVHRPFSALQRAENSSIQPHQRQIETMRVFQCSSASRKFLNREGRRQRQRCAGLSVLFSEPKIPQFNVDDAARLRIERFQCSSASRKFLNTDRHSSALCAALPFSALQRAENSSIRCRNMASR